MESHLAICLACKGDCCRAYPGSSAETANLLPYIKQNPDILVKMLETVYAHMAVNLTWNLLPPHVCDDPLMELQFIAGMNGLERCIFYNQDEGCLVYSRRPFICRNKLCEHISH